MKHLLPLLSLSCAVALAGAAGADEAAPGAGGGAKSARLGGEARFGGVVFDKDCWDDSVGGALDFGLMVWDSGETVGVWAGLGAQGPTFQWEDDWGRVESDVVAIPIGASLLVRCPIAGGVALRGEVGARYVAMDIDDWDDDHYHHRRRGERDRYYHPDRYLDVDDTALAVAGLQLEFCFDPVRLSIGGGYQFDLDKQDMEYLGRSVGKVDLSGAFFYLAFGVVL